MVYTRSGMELKLARDFSEWAEISGFISRTTASCCSSSRGPKLGSWVRFMGEAGEWAPHHDGQVS